MWGWVSRAAMSISRRNRSFPRAAPRSGLSTLRATRRRCFRSSARYTVAMPPRPSSRLIVYRSASATWSRPSRPLIQRKIRWGSRRSEPMAAARGPDSLYRRALPQGVRRQAQAKRESRRAGAPRLRWRSERQATQRSLTWRQYRILATAESMVAEPVSPHQHRYRLRTAAIPKAETRDLARAAARGSSMERLSHHARTGKTRHGSDSCTLATTDSLYCDPTLQAPRDHVRPTPRRLLGG